VSHVADVDFVSFERKNGQRYHFYLSHTTDTTYDKNKTLEAKNKIFKLQGAIVYVTLNFFH
jgi:hypothetical protein